MRSGFTTSGISERRACRLTNCPRRTKLYQSVRTEPEGLRQAIRDIAYAQPRYGIRRVHWWVRQQGFEAGRRRVRRIYREEGLVVRKRLRKRLKAAVRRPMTVPTTTAQRWSMDFVHDQISDGRRFRVFNVVDDPSRSGEAPVEVSGWIRLAIELAILGGGAAAFAIAQRPTIAISVAVLIVIQYATSRSRVEWLLQQ